MPILKHLEVVVNKKKLALKTEIMIRNFLLLTSIARSTHSKSAPTHFLAGVEIQRIQNLQRGIALLNDNSHKRRQRQRKTKLWNNIVDVSERFAEMIKKKKLNPLIMMTKKKSTNRIYSLNLWLAQNNAISKTRKKRLIDSFLLLFATLSSMYVWSYITKKNYIRLIYNEVWLKFHKHKTDVCTERQQLKTRV